jgi:hypothetical protein
MRMRLWPSCFQMIFEVSCLAGGGQVIGGREPQNVCFDARPHLFSLPRGEDFTWNGFVNSVIHLPIQSPFPLFEDEDEKEDEDDL